MSSGVTINDGVLQEFRKLKTRKINYQLCRISDDHQEIIVDKAGKVANYDEFVEILPEDSPRYAIHDYELNLPDGRKTSKIVLFSWLPEASPIKSKMVFASSKMALKSALDGIHYEIQASDYSDLEADEVESRIVR